MTHPEPTEPPEPVRPTQEEAVLLLRLAGPLQAWGSRSAVNQRETGAEPTKSGIVGLLAAACGHARTDPLDELTALRLGVRVDASGTLMRDFHTVSDYRGRALPQAGVSAKGVQRPTSPAKHTHVTARYYLQDAVFVAALAGPRALLERLDAAVRAPAYPLALGRRSCPPTQPVSLGVHGGSVEDALREHPWQASPRARERHLDRVGREQGAAGPYRPARVARPVTVEDPYGTDVVQDVPVSFDPLARSFTERWITRDWYAVPTGFPPSDTGPDAPPDTSPDAPPDSPPGGPSDAPPGHDPFTLLR
ncbi:type I-E CRISPR-associated protein Cas5/CasD [Streptomyces sp. NPDC047315]|uniref:type I-E CRISPR-associated protein Cas5/CasD n=1 Tax=Streptomyces sp. NPDC047315 TaxID=3155142 RepID=UPI0033D34BBB